MWLQGHYGPGTIGARPKSLPSPGPRPQLSPDSHRPARRLSAISRTRGRPPTPSCHPESSFPLLPSAVGHRDASKARPGPQLSLDLAPPRSPCLPATAVGQTRRASFCARLKPKPHFQPRQEQFLLRPVRFRVPKPRFVLSYPLAASLHDPQPAGFPSTFRVLSVARTGESGQTHANHTAPHDTASHVEDY